ncbi:MAG: hypothetical protein LC792_23650 [Actinobacteria bacterium]|nr:hypothetical protein [Actinomycetota bacterium]
MREVFIDIEPNVRVRYRRSEPPPPLEYAVTLEVEIDSEWTTIRLWDNADAVGLHHEHEYTRTQGKQPAVVLDALSTNDAMAAAIHKAIDEWQAILTRWNAEP